MAQRQAGPVFWISLGVALSLLIGLGIWQIIRLGEKQTLLKVLAETQAEAPVDYDTKLTAWHAVILPECEIDGSRIVSLHGVQDGQAGYRLMTVCPAGGHWLLVELGFCTERPEAGFHAIIRPRGRLRPFEKPNALVAANRPQAGEWYWRDPKALSELWKHDLRSDLFVVLTLKDSGLKLAGLIPEDVTASLPNRHLEYALTWFSFAAILLAVALVWRRGVRASPYGTGLT